MTPRRPEAAPELVEARERLPQLEAYLEVLMLRRQDALAEFNRTRGS